MSQAFEDFSLDVSDVTWLVLLSTLIFITIFGNMLIIAAVATTRRLRTVTNYFVVSLAASDLMVGLLVMPFAVVREMTGGLWLFGRIACELWVSLDVMLCTASILNLCCISLDRYFAITRPLAYAVKRSARLALIMIGVVWLVSALITCPPIFGWNDRPQNDTNCEYIDNQGYVVYSALGSFYIPAFIMVYVYWRIFAVARKRQAVLMQETGGSINKEHPGSDSNSSTVGDNSLPNNQDHQRILRDSMDIADDNSLQMSKVRMSSTKSSKGSKRRSSFSIMRSTPFFLSRQNSYNPSFKTKLYHQHHHVGEDWMQQQQEHEDLKAKASTDSTSTSTSPTGGAGGQYCKYCHPQKEEHLKTNRLTIRKKDGYERAAFQRERRVAKSLSVVVGGFIVCWLPFFIVYLIEPFCESCSFNPTLMTCLVWLGWINSAINPLIYALNSNDFKKAFIRLTIDKCRCCRSKTRKGHDPQQFI